MKVTKKQPIDNPEVIKSLEELGLIKDKHLTVLGDIAYAQNSSIK